MQLYHPCTLKGIKVHLDFWSYLFAWIGVPVAHQDEGPQQGALRPRSGDHSLRSAVPESEPDKVRNCTKTLINEVLFYQRTSTHGISEMYKYLRALP